jgi:hypothetical protein
MMSVPVSDRGALGDRGTAGGLGSKLSLRLRSRSLEDDRPEFSVFLLAIIRHIDCTAASK